MTMAEDFVKAIKPYTDNDQWDKVCGVMEDWFDEGKIDGVYDYNDLRNYEPEATETVEITGVTNQTINNILSGLPAVKIKEDELDDAYDMVGSELAEMGYDEAMDNEADDGGCYGYSLPSSQAEISFFGNPLGHEIEINRQKAVELCGEEAIDELDDEADGSGYYIYYTTGIDFDDDTDWITFTDGSSADCYGNLDD